MLKLLYSLLKFGAVGLLGMAIDFSVTWIAKEKLKINKYLANALGFTLAVINNYLLNRWWTFSSKNPEVFRQFFQFLMVSCIGLLLNSLFLYLFHKKLNLNFYLSKLLAIGIVFIWNFFANLLFTFSNGNG